jgi:hypothetical protein
MLGKPSAKSSPGGDKKPGFFYVFCLRAAIEGL